MKGHLLLDTLPLNIQWYVVMMARKSCDHELTVCSYQHVNFHLLILHSSSLSLSLFHSIISPSLSLFHSLLLLALSFSCLSLSIHVEFIFFSSLHHYKHDSWNVDGQSYIFSSCFCLSPLLCPDPVSSSSLSLFLPTANLCTNDGRSSAWEPSSSTSTAASDAATSSSSGNQYLFDR